MVYEGWPAKKVVVQKFADCWILLVFLPAGSNIYYRIPLGEIKVYGEKESGVKDVIESLESAE